MRKLRILKVITGLNFAGAETQVKDLAIELKKRGHSLHVVSLTTPKAFVEELRAADIGVSCLQMNRDKKTPVSFVRAALTLRRQTYALKPHLVHSHMVHANLLSRAALFGGPPLICTAHNIHEGGALRDWAYRMTNAFSALDTTISSAATNRFLDKRVFIEGRTITISNGIEICRYRPKIFRVSEGRNFRWVAIGRLHEQKDYPTLLKALSMIPDALLDIIGEGDLMAELKRQSHELGVSGRVQFLGLRTDVPELLPCYDGFVLSSAWEGFGLVVAEAMASALPVVVTRSGGPEGIVGEDEAAGFLVPPRAPVELAAAMRRLMELAPEQRMQMGRAGRKRIEDNFDLQAIVSRWEDVYQKLVTGRAAVQ